MIATDYQNQLFKLMPLPSVLLSVDAPRYTILYANDAYLKTTNSSENDIIGKGIFEAFPNNPNNNLDGVNVLTQSLATILQTKQPQKMATQHHDIPIRGTDNFEERHFDCENIPILNHEGNVEFLLHVIVDVTEKVISKQASNILQYRNAFVENVLQNLPIGVAINKISNGEAINLNKNFSAIYGWPEEELTDVNTFFEKVYPDPIYRNEIATRIIADMQSGDANKMAWNNIIVTTKTGEQRIINAKNIPLFDQDLMISTVTDITEIAKQSQEIERIKSNQEALINATEDSIWSVDTNLCLITANRAYLEKIESVSQIQPKEGDSAFIEAFGDELNNKWKGYYDKALNGESYTIKEHFYNPITQRNEYGIISFNPIYNAAKVITGIACYSKDITDEIITQQVLETTKNKLSNVLNSSLDVICVVDETNIFLQVSAASETVWGYKPEELVGKNVMDFVYTEDVEQTKTKAATIMAGNKATNFENRYIHKNGSLVWMEWTATWDEHSKARYGVARNVTEKKKQQLALIDSEKRYKNLFENNPSPMFIWDFDTLQILDCNEETILKYGYTKEEFLQLTIKDIRPAEDIALIEAATVSEEVYGEIHKQIWRHQKKNGDILFMDISGHLIDYNGKRASLVVLHDITEKLKIEDQIKTSEAKYRSLVESSVDGILLTVKNGNIISANAAACQIFQMTEEEICNSGREGLVDMTDPRLPILLQERELTGKAKGELTFKRKDGTTFPGEITSVVFKDMNGEERSSMTIRDITEIKKAEEALKHSEEKYKILFVSSPLPKWIYDLDTLSILDVNDAAIAHYGYSKKEFLQLNLSDLQPTKNSTDLLKVQPNIKSSEGILHFGIFTHQKKDGTHIQVDISGNKFNYQNTDCMMVVCVDVTEREKAFVKLNESNQRYNYVTKATFDAIWDWDVIQDTLYWGESYQTIFGYNLNTTEISISSWKTNIHPDDIDRVLTGITALINSNTINWEDEYRYRKSDNTFANVIDRGFVIRDEQGKAIRMVGSMRDITKRKQEELHLKLLESVITYTTDSVMITEAEPFDEPGPRIIYVNEAFTKMTGYTEAEFIGKTPRILHGPKTNKADLKKLGNSLRNWETCELTVLNYKKNGEEFWVNMSITPVADSKGWFTHFIAIERDVTHLKKAELQKALVTDITQLFNEPITLNQISQEVLAELANFIKVDVAEMWLINTDKKKINLFAKHAQTIAAQSFHQDSATDNSFVKGQSLPGIIWEKETVQLWPNLQDEANFIRKKAAKKAGLQCAYGLPLFYNNEVIGVVLLLASSAKTQNINDLHQLFETIGNTISAEIRRKQLEQELNQIFSFAPDIICIAGTDGYFKKVNPAACELLEYTEEELLAQPYSAFVHPNDREATITETNNLSSGVPTLYFENRYITKSGKIKYLAWTSSPVTDDHLFYAVAKEISEKKELEEKIKSERNLLRTLIDNLPDTIYFKDTSARKLISNKVDYQLLGATSEAEVLGKTDFELLDSRLANIGYIHDMEILASGNPIINFEEVFVKENGDPLWLLTTKVALRNHQNNIIGILGIGRDITERKKDEQKLQELNNNLEKSVKELLISNIELEQFAYVASHDLQEPLRMITSFLTQLEKKYNNTLDNKGKQYIEFAVDGAKRMRQIILDLLEYSRVGKTEDEQEHVNLNELVEDIKYLCRQQIQEKGAIISVQHLPTIMAHQTPLRQVFQNIISNALKYTKANQAVTHINISVIDADNYWQFAIADDGLGISKEYFDKIFIIFQRLHTKEEFSGTGMGLAITKKIIEGQGGKIWVESEEGNGSTFYFTLPKTV